MNTETPTPRLVPDRPSDPMKLLREAVARLHGNSLVAHDKIGGPYSEGVCKGVHEALRIIDRAIAAAPPAEAPERDAVECVALAIANVVGHGMAEKCEAQARAAIAALSAEAPAERGDKNILGPHADDLEEAAAPAAPAEGGWLRELLDAAKVVEQTCVRHDANDAAAFRRLEAAILASPRVTGWRADAKHVHTLERMVLRRERTGCVTDKGRRWADAEKDALLAAIAALQSATGGEVGNE